MQSQPAEGARWAMASVQKSMNVAPLLDFVGHRIVIVPIVLLFLEVLLDHHPQPLLEQMAMQVVVVLILMQW